MISNIAKFFKRNNSTQNEITPLEDHIFIARYIISTHLLSAGEEINIFDVDGSPLLPYMDRELTNKDYEHLVQLNSSIIMYNALAVEDFPNHNELKNSLVMLEKGLRNNAHNPWVVRLIKSYEHNLPIKKDSFLKLPSSETIKFEIARSSYESSCGKWVKQFENDCQKKAIRKSLMTWFNKKFREAND